MAAAFILVVALLGAVTVISSTQPEPVEESASIQSEVNYIEAQLESAIADANTEIGDGSSSGGPPASLPPQATERAQGAIPSDVRSRLSSSERDTLTRNLGSAIQSIHREIRSEGGTMEVEPVDTETRIIREVSIVGNGNVDGDSYYMASGVNSVNDAAFIVSRTRLPDSESEAVSIRAIDDDTPTNTYSLRLWRDGEEIVVEREPGGQTRHETSTLEIDYAQNQIGSQDVALEWGSNIDGVQNIRVTNGHRFFGEIHMTFQGGSLDMPTSASGGSSVSVREGIGQIAFDVTYTERQTTVTRRVQYSIEDFSTRDSELTSPPGGNPPTGGGPPADGGPPNGGGPTNGDSGGSADSANVGGPCPGTQEQVRVPSGIENGQAQFETVCGQSGYDSVVNFEDGSSRVVNTNGESGIQFYQQGVGTVTLSETVVEQMQATQDSGSQGISTDTAVIYYTSYINPSLETPDHINTAGTVAEDGEDIVTYTDPGTVPSELTQDTTWAGGEPNQPVVPNMDPKNPSTTSPGGDEAQLVDNTNPTPSVTPGDDDGGNSGPQQTTTQDGEEAQLVDSVGDAPTPSRMNGGSDSADSSNNDNSDSSNNTNSDGNSGSASDGGPNFDSITYNERVS